MWLIVWLQVAYKCHIGTITEFRTHSEANWDTELNIISNSLPTFSTLQGMKFCFSKSDTTLKNISIHKQEFSPPIWCELQKSGDLKDLRNCSAKESDEWDLKWPWLLMKWSLLETIQVDRKLKIYRQIKYTKNETNTKTILKQSRQNQHQS